MAKIALIFSLTRFLNSFSAKEVQGKNTHKPIMKIEVKRKRLTFAMGQQKKLRSNLSQRIAASLLTFVLCEVHFRRSAQKVIKC